MVARRFDFGATLSRYFSILFRALPAWIGIATLTAIPVFFLGFAAFYIFDIPDVIFSEPKLQVEQNFDFEDVIGILISYGLFSIFSTIHLHLTAAATVYGVFKKLRNEPVNVIGCLMQVVRRILPLTALSIVLSIAFTAAQLLCCFPYAFALAAWGMAVPALMVENMGPLESLTRSRFLSQKIFWPCVGFFLLVLVIYVGAWFFLSVFSFIPNLSIIVTIVSTLLAPLMVAIASGVLYHDLREAKEGLSAIDLGTVFD